MFIIRMWPWDIVLKKRFAREEKDSNIATSKIFSFTSYQPTCPSGFSYVCVLRSHKHKNRLHLVWVVQVTDFIWMKCVLSWSQFIQIIRFWCILDRAFQLHTDSWFNFWCHDPFLGYRCSWWVSHHFHCFILTNSSFSSEIDYSTFSYYIDGETAPSIEFVPYMAVGAGFDDGHAPWGTKWIGKAARFGGWFNNL